MGRATYLTARCPTGCEAWLHPYALDQHIDGRCRGHPWVDDLPDTAVIPNSYAEVILGVVDESLISLVPLERSSRVDARDGRLRDDPSAVRRLASGTMVPVRLGVRHVFAAAAVIASLALLLGAWSLWQGQQDR